MKFLKSNLKKLAPAIFLAALGLSATAQQCNGSFPNPATDICLSLAFPLKLGSVTLIGADQLDTTTLDASTPACSCPPKVMAGFTTNFWAPQRSSETYLKPGCAPLLNGLEMPMTPGSGIIGPEGVESFNDDTGSNFSTKHFSMYKWPLLSALNLVIPNTCGEVGPLDMVYRSELDPAASDEALAMLRNWDLAGFAVPMALEMAQAMKAIAGSLDFSDPISEFTRRIAYPVGGACGNLAPWSINTNEHIDTLSKSVCSVAKAFSNAQRSGIIWERAGSMGLCGVYPSPLFNDVTRKITMVTPVPQTVKIKGRCGQPMSAVNDLWGVKKGVYPNNAFMAFEKTSCCLGKGL